MTAEVTFQQCVERSLVHRYAVSEVFVTDLVETGSDTCVIGAQLPMSHAYFLDDAFPAVGFTRTAPPPRRYGPALLAECARQACTYLAHRRYGVPLDWNFLMTGLSVRITDPGALSVGARPAELTMLQRLKLRSLSG